MSTDATPYRAADPLAIIAEAIRSVDLDAMTADDLSAMLEQGDVADAEARAVLVALNLNGYSVCLVGRPGAPKVRDVL